MLGFVIAIAALGCASPGDGTSTKSIAGAGDACTVDADCAAGLECDDGACKQHGGRGDDDDRDGGVACTTVADCAAGEECDDGACKRDEDDDDNDRDGGVACTTDADCAGGEECDDGACKPHGGDGD